MCNRIMFCVYSEHSLHYYTTQTNYLVILYLASCRSVKLQLKLQLIVKTEAKIHKSANNFMHLSFSFKHQLQLQPLALHFGKWTYHIACFFSCQHVSQSLTAYNSGKARARRHNLYGRKENKKRKFAVPHFNTFG